MIRNRDRLREIVIDSLLLDPGEFRPDLTRDQVETWDSLGAVALAAAVEDTFRVHLTPQEADGIRSVPDLVAALTARGVDLDAAADGDAR